MKYGPGIRPPNRYVRVPPCAVVPICAPSLSSSPKSPVWSGLLNPRIVGVVEVDVIATVAAVGTPPISTSGVGPDVWNAFQTPGCPAAPPNVLEGTPLPSAGLEPCKSMSTLNDCAGADVATESMTSVATAAARAARRQRNVTDMIPPPDALKV